MHCALPSISRLEPTPVLIRAMTYRDRQTPQRALASRQCQAASRAASVPAGMPQRSGRTQGRDTRWPLQLPQATRSGAARRDEHATAASVTVRSTRTSSWFSPTTTSSAPHATGRRSRRTAWEASPSRTSGRRARSGNYPSRPIPGPEALPRPHRRVVRPAASRPIRAGADRDRAGAGRTVRPARSL
jgi:hypothetical protein